MEDAAHRTICFMRRLLQASILDGGSFDPFSFDQGPARSSQLSQPSLEPPECRQPCPQEREAARQHMCKGLDRALSSPLASIFD